MIPTAAHGDLPWPAPPPAIGPFDLMGLGALWLSAAASLAPGLRTFSVGGFALALALFCWPVLTRALRGRRRVR
ncbi:MAG: hypothetical protein ACFB2Z_08110 [Maricaulaceae bacterium]